MAYPSKGDMIDMVNGLCLIEDKIKAELGFDFMKDPKLSNVEALKVPMFYVWSRLYGHTHTLLLRESEIPYIDMELRNLLINFYSELSELYNS